MMLTELNTIDLVAVVVISTMIGNILSMICDNIIELLASKKNKKGEENEVDS